MRQTLLLGLAGAVFGCLLGLTGALDRVEGITWDVRQRLWATPAPDDGPVQLVLIGDQSETWAREDRGLKWPWPREIFAGMLHHLHAAGAKAVVFDLDFIAPSPHDVEDDELLQFALRDFGRVVLPLRTPGPDPRWPPAGRAVEVTGLERAVPLAAVAPSCPDVLGAGPVHFGHATAEAERVVRRVRALRAFDERALPQMGLAAVAIGGRVVLGDDTVEVAGRRAPLDAHGNLVLRFRRPRPNGKHLYPTTSAAQVLKALLDGHAPDLRFKDAYVVVGVSGQNRFDNWALPVRDVSAGAEVHATVIDNLLNDAFLRPAPWFAVWSLTLVTCLLAAFTMRWKQGPLANTALATIFLPLPVMLGGAVFPAGLAWPIVAPFAAVAATALATGGVNYFIEGRQRRYVRRAFEHYLSPAVIARIMDDPSRLELGGERRTLSIFFSDLQGFSTFSEQLDPQKLAELLNDYLSDMTAIVLDEDGTLDKYEGDAIIAFWNAPADQPDHALRAVRAGLRCQKKLRERRAEFKQKYDADLYMRIGIHTGEVSVGNFGSRDRFDYTVLGDAANLASRLEGANKAFGTYFMVSDATWRGLHDKIAGRTFGRVKVVGRKEPMRVHEPLEDEKALEQFKAARALCEAARWDEAEAALEACGPDDGLARVYLDRVRTHNTAGKATWNDLWILDAK